jgi:hypothetical protein
MRIRALATILHGGTAHPPGTTLDVPDGTGFMLLRRGLAREAPPVVDADLPADAAPVPLTDETTTSRRTTRAKRDRTRDA